MTTPSEKSPEMTDYLERAFGRSTSIRQNVCTICRREAVAFRDSLSEKEYTISGLCQDCQDSVFGVDDD